MPDNYLKTSSFAFFILIIILIIAVPLEVAFINCAEEYVYYGVVPERIYIAKPRKLLHAGWDPAAGWAIDDNTVTNSAILAIIAQKDNTNVRIFTFDANIWVSKTQLNLNRMEKRFITLLNGTVFKAVSNQLVSIMLIGGGGELDPNSNEGPIPATFYISTDGCYIGKEFIFVASQGLSYEPYRIFTLEDSKVTIYVEDGTETSFDLKANEFKILSMSVLKGYRITSTGNIMVQSGGPGYHRHGVTSGSEGTHRSFFVPSAEGGFLGRHFYSDAESRDVAGKWGWDPREECGFRISALEDTKVTVWDVKLRQKLQELDVKGGEATRITPEASVIMVESDKPVTLSFIHDGGVERVDWWSYGAGVTYIGIKANEETPFYLPMNSTVKAYVFAYEDIVVKIDDAPVTIKADSYFTLTAPGFHKVTSNKNTVIQVIHWPLEPDIQGIHDFGVDVPSIQAVDVKPTVKLSPLTIEEGFPMTYILIGAIAAVAVTAVAFIALKRRPK